MRTAVLFSLVVTMSCRPPAGAEPFTASVDGPPCVPSSLDIAAAAVCLQSQPPSACLGLGGCDADDDGISDAAEQALVGAYAPVFAFNSGRRAAVREPAWPASAAHFVRHANLTYRPDGVMPEIVATHASLETLGGVGVNVDGEAIRADDPSTGAGSDFWLCHRDKSAAARVETLDEMLRIDGGIDVVTVVRPANGMLADSSHLALSYVLLFAFNPFDLVGDHEGDWEGLTVFVNLGTGAVDAAWFERHGTTDNVKLVSVEKHGAKDPADDEDASHGLRFWDVDGARHRVVAYVSQGSHAMYDAPGETRIYPPGPSDAHMGDDVKLLTWRGRLVDAWGGEEGTAVAVNLVNPGEAAHITLPWARYRGQWGCQDGVVGKSWPGPFGNARHPRPMFERAWGSPPSDEGLE